MRRALLALMCTAPCLAQQARLNFTGVVAGTLRGDDGSAIVGGYVSLALLPPHPKRLPQIEWTGVTGVGGTFRFGALNDGKYRLCAQAPKSTWLSSCDWGLQPLVVTLSAAEPVARVTIVMKKGVAVPIRVDDPAGLLSQHEGKTPGAHLLIGVGNDAFVFVPASVTSQDAKGRNQQVVIPFNAPVKLVVYSSFFQLADAMGVALPKTGAAIVLTIPTGQQPATIGLRVTGGGR